MTASLVTLAIVAASVVFFLAFLFAVIKAFYVVPSADEALVKTGGKEPTVHTGGVFVIPLIHRVKRVSLNAVQVPIRRLGADALPTLDGIPAEIQGELIVQVDPGMPAHIILAAQSLRAEGAKMGEAIEKQIKSLVEDALRTATFQRTFIDVQAEKQKFAEEVLKHLQNDLLKLGLTLKAVTIPHIAQGQFNTGPDDVIASMGRKNVAVTVAANAQATNLTKRDAEMAIRKQDLSATQQKLSVEQDQRESEAEQARQIAEMQATKDTEARTAVLTQEQARMVAEAEQKKAVQTAQIMQEQAVESARIAQEQTLAVQRAGAAAVQKKAEEEGARVRQEAEIARAKSVETAQIDKEQTVRVATENQQRAISEAAIAREVAIAASRKTEAEARGAQALAEAERQRAEQSIVTVEAEAKATREKSVVVIQAQREAETQRVAADRDAYVVAKRAEGERDAASKRAEAAVAEATGRNDAAVVTAKGAAENLLVTAKSEQAAAEMQADAQIKLAGAISAEGEARAHAARKLVEAENTISQARLARDVAMKALDVAPAVIHAFMEPIAAVSDVRIIQVNGLGGGADGQASVPGTILGTGMALSGVLPILREAVSGLVQNDDVRAVGAVLKQVGLDTLREASSAARGTGTDTSVGEAK